jgi:hypothetical protein
MFFFLKKCRFGFEKVYFRILQLYSASFYKKQKVFNSVNNDIYIKTAHDNPEAFYYLDATTGFAYCVNTDVRVFGVAMFVGGTALAGTKIDVYLQAYSGAPTAFKIYRADGQFFEMGEYEFYFNFTHIVE